MESLRDKSIAAFFWVLIDKAGSSMINFAVTIWLARLLQPSDFGLVAMVMVFFELSNSFIQSGFGFALIREKEISEIDKSTAFVFNLVTALVLYAVLFFSAPAIASFFSQPDLKLILRVLGANLIIGSISLIQFTMLTQKIDFKTQTKVRFAGTLFSGVCAVFMAAYGYGFWSLVARLILMELSSGVLLWAINPWRPSFLFSILSFRKLFGFGSKLLMEALIDKFFRHVLQLIIGKFFTVSILGFFAQANNFCNMAANNFQQAIQKVTYPVLVKMRDDPARLKEGYRRIITMSSFVILPVMALMGVLAEPLILALVGEKWIDSVPFLRLLCLAGVTYHFNSINLDLLLVLGRVDLCLKLEVIKKAITGLVICAGIQFGIEGLVLAQVFSNYISLFINTYYTDKFLSYPISEQLKDIAPSILFSLLAGLSAMTPILFSSATPAQLLFGGSTMGGIVYLVLHLLVKTREIQLFREVIIPKTLRFIQPKA
jgi:teichuronic acid exporter